LIDQSGGSESGHFCKYSSQSYSSQPLATQLAMGSATETQQMLPIDRNAGVNPDALVFSTQAGTPFDRHNLVNRQLKPTCKKLGLKDVTWHWLRHANATLLDSVGTPLGTVQVLLGHSSSDITCGVYLHSVPADAKAAVQIGRGERI
jgi:site-specific recombinase XerD